MHYVLHPHEQRVMDSTARFIAAISGIQGGKTTTGSFWMAREIAKNPFDDFLIAAPTYKILEQSTLKKFFDIFPMWAVEYHKQDQVLKILKEGGGYAGNIFIRSAETPNTIEGMTVRAAWLDEAGMMKQQVWTNVLGRVSIKQGRVLFTTTPYNVGWLYEEIVRKAEAGDPSFELVKWRSIDNPYFPREEYERAKQLLHPAEFERRYHGEFRKMEGLVYPDFKANRMTYSSLPDKLEFTEVFAGMDYGFTNPAAIVVVGLGKDGHLYILDEVYQTRLDYNGLVAQARELRDKWEVKIFYVDPSAPGLVDLLNSNGLTAQPGNNDVDAGIPMVRQVISSGHLRVWVGCYNLLDELELYAYKPSLESGKNLEYQQKPNKVHDHAVDALRYAIATHPLDIFEVYIPEVEDRRTEFWKHVAKRHNRRRMVIDRYGADYPDEDAAVLDDLLGYSGYSDPEHVDVI